jgi:hydrogenase maturation protease
MSTPLVLGIGNLLMGDEGVGVHAVTDLDVSFDDWPVRVVDGGTGGFHLLGYLREYRPIVMIDAAMDGRAPGTVSLIRPRYASDYPRSLTAHDIGLRDLIEAAALSGSLPEVWLITVSIAEIAPMQTQLSAPVQAALPHVRALVLACLAESRSVEPRGFSHGEAEAMEPRGVGRGAA